MRKKALIMSIMALGAFALASAETWTLERCIDYATEHNITVKMRQAGQQQAALSVTEAKSGYLPRLSASAGQSWNIGRGLTAANTYADRNTSNFNWSASLSVPIFNGMQTTRRVQYAKANLAQVTEQYEAAKEDISINIITAYLQVLYSKEMLATARHQVDISTNELARQQALVDAGKIPEVDMLQARSQLANDELNLTQIVNDEILARVDLVQLLELDTEVADFDVAPISDMELTVLSPDQAYERALQFNHSIRAARRGIDVSDRSISLAKSGYLPTLSFSGGLGSSYFKVSGMPNDNFSSQMKNNYSTYFGFSLNVPIFDAFSTRNNVRRAKAEKVNAELQLDQAEQQLFRSIQQAYYQATSAHKKLESCLVAEDAAVKAFDAMREKYNIGRATPTEYEQAKSKALTATANRISARYELTLRSRLLEYYTTEH